MQLFSLLGKIAVDNSNANKAIDDTQKKTKETEQTTEKSTSKMKDAWEKVGKVGATVVKGFAAVAGGAAALGGGIIALSASTAEYTEDMGKLTVAFDQQGFSADTAKDVYKDFVGILGETDQAVEAANHLAQLCDNEQDLAEWTDIAAGIYATFGDSLPIEGLTEAANETARVGQVTGPFADALNWANVNLDTFTAGMKNNQPALDAFNAAIEDGQSREDAFTAALQACGNEQERGQLVTETLTALYGEAGKQYEETNGDLIESRKAQADWNEAMSAAGDAVRPLANALTDIGTQVVEAALPYLGQFSGWVQDNLPAWQETFETVFGVIKDAVKAVVDKFQELKQWMDDNKTAVEVLGGVLVVAAAAMTAFGVSLGIVNAIQAVKTAIDGFKTSMGLLNAVMAANPFMIVITVIAALVAAIVYLWTTNEDFRNAVTNVWNAIKTTAESVFKAVGDFFTNTWNGIKSTAESVWNGIGSFLSGLWDGIKTTASNVFNGIKDTVSNIWNGIKTTTSNLWNGIKTTVSNVVNGIKDTVSNVFNNIKTTAENVWNGIKSAIETPINKAKDIVKNVIDSIKGFFNFKISWPHIPMPHFSIKPAGWSVGDLLKGSIPSLGISWYAKGGIFDQPTILPTAEGLAGVGEAGPEAVAPISVLMDYVREAVKAENAKTAVAVEALRADVREYLTRVLGGMDRAVVLDTGTLVGELALPMDAALGNVSRNRARGR